jgi:hypothetical protein
VDKRAQVAGEQPENGSQGLEGFYFRPHQLLRSLIRSQFTGAATATLNADPILGLEGGFSPLDTVPTARLSD